MPKKCDNTSVGILIEQDGRHAMIFRGNYPRAWAMIAGHVDEHGTPKDAIRVETQEEGSLHLVRFVEIPFGEDIDNPCKREGGTHHVWRIFEAYDWEPGELRVSSDAKKAEWKTRDELQALAHRTEYFMKKFGIPYTLVSHLTEAIHGTFDEPNEDPEWTADPGLEVVWYFILKKLGRI